MKGVSEEKLKELEQYLYGYGSRHDATILSKLELGRDLK